MVPKFGRRGKAQEGWKATPKRSYSCRTGFSRCVKSFGMEATSPAWMEIASNRALAPKGIDVAAPFLMCRKGKGTFRGQGRTLSSNWD